MLLAEMPAGPLCEAFMAIRKRDGALAALNMSGLLEPRHTAPCIQSINY